MTFSNEQIDRSLLPRFHDVELQRLDPRYARVVLGCALVVIVPAFLFVTTLFFAVLIPVADMPPVLGFPLYAAISAFLAIVAWYSGKAASLVRYAVRQHDIIVRKGVFWKRETIQPIRRIQHVEQHQGPVDKRFGLYTLKLFSAGTGHFTFEIPGLDEAMASGIKSHVLTVKQQDWSERRAESPSGEGSAPRDDQPPAHSDTGLAAPPDALPAAPDAARSEAASRAQPAASSAKAVEPADD